MSRIIIADVRSLNTNGKAIGHYFTVAQNYLDVFKNKANINVAGGPLYKEKFSKDLIELQYDTNAEDSTAKNKLKVLCNLKQLFSLCGSDDVVIMQSSAVATSFLGVALFKKKQTRVYMIQYSAENINSLPKRILYAMAKKKINGILCPNEKVGQAYKTKYCVVPDYIYVKRNIPALKKQYDFGMVGVISRDKGVIEAVDFLKNKDYKILIAGRPENEGIRDELLKLKKESNNIDFRLEYLSDKEYENCINECKYCILNYSDAYSEHSSGVVFDIIYRGVPVIGKSCESLNFISKFGLGKIVDSINDLKIDEVLDEKKYTEYIENINRYYGEQENEVWKLKNFLMQE